MFFLLPLSFFIIDWSASNTASVFQYAGYLFSDFSEPLSIIIGVGVFIIILEVIIHAITGRQHK